jgi:hypothetical protein
MPASRASAAISAMGCIAPVSLLACMMVISDGRGAERGAHVAGRLHDAGRSYPDSQVTATPSRSSRAQAFSTAGCSMALVIT